MVDLDIVTRGKTYILYFGESLWKFTCLRCIWMREREISAHPKADLRPWLRRGGGSIIFFIFGVIL
jgi:hypothetical protein